MRTSTIRLLQLAVIAVPLALWWLATTLAWASPDVLPALGDVIAQFGTLPLTGAFWIAVGNTLGNAAIGLLLSFIVGVPLGLALGLSAGAYNATRILLDIGRSMPFFGLVPALILLLGAGPKLVIVMIFSSCVFPLLIQSAYGSRQTDPAMMLAVRSYRIPFVLRWRKVILPGAVPYIGTGLRIVIVMAVMVSIGVETLVQVPGVGREIADAQQDGATPEMYAYVVLAGFIGLGANTLALAVERFFLRWRPPTGMEQ